MRPDPIRDAARLGFPQLVGNLLSMPASCSLAPTQRDTVVLEHTASHAIDKSSETKDILSSCSA
jgi:hypothetical protein